MKKAVAFATGAAMFLSAAPAFATHSDDIDIDIDNYADVYNEILTVANTGDNSANGGDADSTVYSGDIDDDNDDSNTGNDDNDANGGNGGTNNTGDAWATSDVLNDVNSSDVDVDTDCDCDDDDINIDIDNDAYVTNYVDTVANTGDNSANGGDADSYVSSGNIDDNNWDSNTGNEDNDANGGDGGENNTGDADAESVVTNIVNLSIVRVTRN